MSAENENEEEKARVVIYGDEYVIKGEEPVEYIEKVADCVDQEIEKVNGQSNRLSRVKVMVLAAMNLADQYYKIKEKKQKLSQKLKNEEAGQTELKQKYKEIVKKHNRLKSEYNTMQKKYNALHNENDNFKEKYNNLKEKYNDLVTKHENLKENHQELKEEYEAFLIEFDRED